MSEAYEHQFTVLIHRSAIAHVYPAYRSYQAVQRGRGDELSNWLTYWGVLGVFHTGEVIADFFIWWLPFYEEAKILLVLWLVVPEGNVHLRAGPCQSHKPFLPQTRRGHLMCIEGM